MLHSASIDREKGCDDYFKDIVCVSSETLKEIMKVKFGSIEFRVSSRCFLYPYVYSKLTII
jgi:hypothetical protein